MSKVSKWIASGVVAGACMWGVNGAEAADATIGADVVSSYVFRGETLNNDPVVQPSLTVEHPSGLAISVWANFDLGDDDGAYAKNEFSEIDFDVSYTVDLDMVSLTLGYTEYTYPGFGVLEFDEEGNLLGITAAADREVYVAVGAEVIAGLDLGVTVYQNARSSKGTYVELNAEYGLQIIEDLTVSLLGSVGYGDKDVTVGGKAGWNDYLVGVNVEMEIAPGLTVNGFVNYVGSLDSDVLLKDAVEKDVFGGVGVYYAF